MEAVCSSEASVDFQRTTLRYIPDDGTVHNHRCEDLQSNKTALHYVQTFRRAAIVSCPTWIGSLNPNCSTQAEHCLLLCILCSVARVQAKPFVLCTYSYSSQSLHCARLYNVVHLKSALCSATLIVLGQSIKYFRLKISHWQKWMSRYYGLR